MRFPLLTPDEQTDLVLRVERGDAEAETRLVQLFSAAIRTMTRARTRGTLDGDDVSQDVMIAAITAIRRGQLRESDRLGAFIAGIARNVINNQLRVHGSRPVEPLMSDEAAVSDFREEITRRDRTRMVRAALDDLRVEDKRILVLTLVDGLKSGEIAERLGLDPEVVRTRKSRAIRRLTDRLKSN
jgi:RNA polymerase sigma-70 factor (ECF subfamily)